MMTPKVFIRDEAFHRELLPKMVTHLTDQNLKDYLEFHLKDFAKWEKEIELLTTEIAIRKSVSQLLTTQI